MLKKTIYENITLGVDATFDNGKKIKGSIAFLTKDYNIELTEEFLKTKLSFYHQYL